MTYESSFGTSICVRYCIRGTILVVQELVPCTRIILLLQRVLRFWVLVRDTVIPPGIILVVQCFIFITRQPIDGTTLNLFLIRLETPDNILLYIATNVAFP